MRHSYLCIIAASAAIGACAETEQVGNTDALDAARSSNAPGSRAPANSVTSIDGSAPDRRSVGGEVAPGEWFERRSGEERWAGFGPPNSEASFSARCEGKDLILSTTEVPQSGPGQTTMYLSADGVEESLRATTSEAGLPNTEARVPATASWLRQLQYSTGNLTVRVASGEPLTVPISQPLTSLISDCRRAS